MKKRLLDKMGQEASGVNIYTYHSFCFEIIQNNPDLFEQYSGFQIINDTVKKSLIRQCIEELDTVYYKTSSGDKYHFAGEILTRIDDIKKNLLSKDKNILLYIKIKFVLLNFSLKYSLFVEINLNI